MHRLQAVGWLVICSDNRALSDQILLLIRSQAAVLTAALVTARSQVIPCKRKMSLPLAMKLGCIVEDHSPHCAHRLPRSVSEEETAVQDKLTVLATMGSPVVQHIVAS